MEEKRNNARKNFHFTPTTKLQEVYIKKREGERAKKLVNPCFPPSWCFVWVYQPTIPSLASGALQILVLFSSSFSFFIIFDCFSYRLKILLLFCSSHYFSSPIILLNQLFFLLISTAWWGFGSIFLALPPYKLL